MVCFRVRHPNSALRRPTTTTWPSIWRTANITRWSREKTRRRRSEIHTVRPQSLSVFRTVISFLLHPSTGRVHGPGPQVHGPGPHELELVVCCRFSLLWFSGLVWPPSVRPSVLALEDTNVDQTEDAQISRLCLNAAFISALTSAGHMTGVHPAAARSEHWVLSSSAAEL